MRSRLRRHDGEAGVYAILYAILCVVLLGMAAIVVDFASVRQDRRADRAAADAAALGGVKFLDVTATGGANPYQACLEAWKYLSSTLRITTPAGVCSAFVGVTAATYCTVANPPLIADDRTVGSRTYRVAWPIPASGDGGFLTPDLAPGTVDQPQNTAASPGPTNTDGYSNGCDKLGVAVFQDQGFGLANVWSYTGTSTQVHSVARVLPNAGPPGTAAALNVLADDCETLTAKGGGSGGFVFVGPVLDDDGNVVAPGSIAVESSANACGGGNTAIDVTGNNVICASRSAVTASTCTGDGVILDHALDPGGNSGAAYSGTTTQLRPTPIAEQGTESYVPVTKHYGCNALPNCQPPATNYIRSLVTAYGGSGVPTSVYSASHSPYMNPYPGAFVDRSSTLCSAITTVVIVPAGNNYAGCSLNIQGSGTLIVQGGTLVIDGGIQNSGCLVMNTAVTTCPAGVVNGGTPQVTTPVRPTSDATVFLRGRTCAANKCFDNSGSLVFPQTFLYSQAAIAPLNQASGALTLWTAPDAGQRDVNGRTTLDNACLVPATGSVDPDCLDSRFARMTYWSEATFQTNNPNVFIGQGNLNVVGVFFTPLAAFKFSGGSGYASAAAQFWSAYLTVAGGAQLGISPIDRFSLPPLGPHLELIR